MDVSELSEHVSYDITEILHFLTWATFQQPFHGNPPPTLFLLSGPAALLSTHAPLNSGTTGHHSTPLK